MWGFDPAGFSPLAAANEKPPGPALDTPEEGELAARASSSATRVKASRGHGEAAPDPARRSRLARRRRPMGLQRPPLPNLRRDRAAGSEHLVLRSAEAISEEAAVLLLTNRESPPPIGVRILGHRSGDLSTPLPSRKRIARALKAPGSSWTMARSKNSTAFGMSTGRPWRPFMLKAPSRNDASGSSSAAAHSRSDSAVVTSSPERPGSRAAGGLGSGFAHVVHHALEQRQCFVSPHGDEVARMGIPQIPFARREDRLRHMELGNRVAAAQGTAQNGLAEDGVAVWAPVTPVKLGPSLVGGDTRGDLHASRTRRVRRARRDVTGTPARIRPSCAASILAPGASPPRPGTTKSARCSRL